MNIDDLREVQGAKLKEKVSWVVFIVGSLSILITAGALSTLIANSFFTLTNVGTTLMTSMWGILGIIVLSIMSRKAMLHIKESRIVRDEILTIK